MDEAPFSEPTLLPSRRRRWLYCFLGAAAIYFAIAYLVVPGMTSRYYRRHPSLDDNPRITQTGDHHPGDPLNVALIGTKKQINAIMHAARWEPAAALGIKSDIKIAEDTVLSRP